LDRTVERLYTDRQQKREHEHDRRVSEREEETDAHRALALAHDLPRSVVNARDVIGVKRLAQPERVGRNAGTDGECAARPELVARWRDDRYQDEEPERVQSQDHRGHRAGSTPLRGGKPVSEPVPARWLCRA